MTDFEESSQVPLLNDDREPAAEQQPFADVEAQQNQEFQHPLRRQRTSIVRRASIERENGYALARSSIYKQWQTVFNLALILAYITLCLYLPGIFGGERNEECEWSGLKSVNYFGWFVVGPECFWNVCVALYMAYKLRAQGLTMFQESLQNVQYTLIFAKVFFMIGYATWFYWVQFKWGGFSSECMQGWNVLDFINFLLIMGGVFLQTLIVTILLCLFVCCLPCICIGFREFSENLRNNAKLTESITGGLVKTHYDPNTFTNMKECAICMGEFDEDSEVTPLPCNIQHYFHNECVTSWMKEQTKCPLCREEIDMNKLDEFSKECDEKYGFK